MQKSKTENSKNSTKKETANPGSREIIIGIDAIADYLKRGIQPTMDLILKVKIPAEKNQENVWTLDVEKFQKWCKALDWIPWEQSDKDLARKIYRRDLMAAGPGFKIEGDINHLSKNLGFSSVTLNEFQRFVNCPIQMLEGNQFCVFENQWLLFIQEHGPRKIRKDRSWAD